MDSFKCIKCKKKLAEGDIADGKVSIKCKCGTLNTIEVRPKKYVQNAPYQSRINLIQK